jgi:hypothetical protein
MAGPNVIKAGELGWGFVPKQYLPEGADEHYLRNAESPWPIERWRALTPAEIDALVANGNSADDWSNLRVADPFTPALVRNCQFYGLVRIGATDGAALEYHELAVPAGLTNSRIIACDIGDRCAVHNARYLAHYVIGDECMLLDVDEMHTSNHAKFGSGIVKDGEDESVRVHLDVMNEAGGRSILPFDGMTTADAYLWARYREDDALMARLERITQERFDSRRGFYGSVGRRCVIKNCRIVKDVKVGPCAYVKGANKLKNLTVHSSEDAPTQIGEGVELVNGIIGFGSRVFYGCKAVRFVMGDNCSLKYGARLIHSVLGDNSTISCCEVLNNLVFPAHEQHHNNSFLIASLVMGQSNIGAGATLGSNHNSRAPDGEMHAGRGFWPGLCVSVKHNSNFASFTLLSKGSYEYELNVPLPFALVSNDTSSDRLTITPAFWWMYDMYALARNSWKFAARDKRKVKRQNVEFDSLAPDTAEEIISAMRLLEQWTGLALVRAAGRDADEMSARELADAGRELLAGPADKVNGMEILADGVERSSRKAVVVKAHAGYHAYRQMLHYYAVTNVLAYCEANPRATLAEVAAALAGPRQSDWVNLGGQLVPDDDVEWLRTDIRTGKLTGWDDVHRAYDDLWRQYPLARQRHALAVLMTLIDADALTAELWAAALDQAARTQRFIADQTYLTRKKDDENTFRRASYDSDEQMAAVLGTAEENAFVRRMRDEADRFAERAAAAKDALARTAAACRGR